MKIGILVSGEGTNLDSIHRSGIPISVVIADRPCLALHKAQGYRIRRELVPRSDFTAAFDEYRSVYTRRLLRVLKMYDVELVVMAGFMTLLSAVFFERYPERVLGIHPSRLPLFKGKHAVRDTLAAKPRQIITGSTVYVATREVDEGKVLLQSSVPVYANDTAATLTARIKEAEHKLYPAAIKGYLMSIEPSAP